MKFLLVSFLCAAAVGWCINGIMGAITGVIGVVMLLMFAWLLIWGIIEFTILLFGKR